MFLSGGRLGAAACFLDTCELEFGVDSVDPFMLIWAGLMFLLGSLGLPPLTDSMGELMECLPSGETTRGAGGTGGGTFFFCFVSGPFCLAFLFSGDRNGFKRSSRLLALVKNFFSLRGEFPVYGGGGRGREAIGDPLGGATCVHKQTNTSVTMSLLL